MRGRALRIDSKDKAKVASVWHLVTADLFNWSGQSDLVDLNKRFQTFVGLAHTRPAIENGLERLDLPPLAGLDALDLNNSEMQHRLADIRSIEQQWKDATEAGTYKRVVPAVSTRNPRRFRTIHFRNTLMYASLTAALAFAQWFFDNISVTSIFDRTTQHVAICICVGVGNRAFWYAAGPFPQPQAVVAAFAGGRQSSADQRLPSGYDGTDPRVKDGP